MKDTLEVVRPIARSEEETNEGRNEEEGEVGKVICLLELLLRIVKFDSFVHKRVVFLH